MILVKNIFISQLFDLNKIQKITKSLDCFYNKTKFFNLQVFFKKNLRYCDFISSVEKTYVVRHILYELKYMVKGLYAR